MSRVFISRPLTPSPWRRRNVREKHAAITSLHMSPRTFRPITTLFITANRSTPYSSQSLPALHSTHVWHRLPRATATPQHVNNSSVSVGSLPISSPPSSAIFFPSRITSRLSAIFYHRGLLSYPISRPHSSSTFQISRRRILHTFIRDSQYITDLSSPLVPTFTNRWRHLHLLNRWRSRRSTHLTLPTAQQRQLPVSARRRRRPHGKGSIARPAFLGGRPTHGTPPDWRAHAPHHILHLTFDLPNTTAVTSVRHDTLAPCCCCKPNKIYQTVRRQISDVSTTFSTAFFTAIQRA